MSSRAPLKLKPTRAGLTRAANLLRTAVQGTDRSVYVPIHRGNGAALKEGDCIWTDGVTSLFILAHQGQGTLVIDLRVIVEPPAQAVPAVRIPA